MTFCKDWGGKYHGLILRICGILHCVICFLKNENPAEIRVGTRTLCNAISIAEYYREQAIYAYSLSDVDTATIKAEKVLEKIKSKRVQNIRQNDLYRLCRCTLFKNAQDFAETVDMLEEYGYIRRITSTGANNKTITDIIINPAVYR